MIETRAKRSKRGCVFIVGAGPGDPGLITVRGREILRRSEVVVYDRLANPSLLDEAPPSAERLFVGKKPGGHAVPQPEINAVLIDRARAGLRVTRLKGGDPFVFGRGAEEVEALRLAGIECEVVPGVTSVTAVPASEGIPLTDRRHASAFAVVTGHECAGDSDLDWHALARIPTLVILMGLGRLPEIAARLIRHGAAESTPAAVIASGTLPQRRSVVGRLAVIGELARRAELRPPATVIVGDVVRLRGGLDWNDAGRAVELGRLPTEIVTPQLYIADDWIL